MPEKAVKCKEKVDLGHKIGTHPIFRLEVSRDISATWLSMKDKNGMCPYFSFAEILEVEEAISVRTAIASCT